MSPLRRTAARLVAALLVGSSPLVSACTAAEQSPAPDAQGDASAGAQARLAEVPSKGASGGATGGAGGSGSAGTSQPPAPPPPPGDSACYRLTFAALPRSSNDADPVPCRTRHDAQTIYVGRLRGASRDAGSGGSDAGEADRAQRRMARVCPRRLAGFLGGDASRRHLSRFTVVWFRPTDHEAEAGASWFRCDVVVLAGPEALHPLPRPHRLKGVLDHPRALGTFGLCGTAAPGSAHFTRVICDRRHRWRAVSTIRLAGTAYPGRRHVRRAGDSACREQVRTRSGNSLRFRYGWEWPTRDQWRRGQHYGYCWAPDRG